MRSRYFNPLFQNYCPFILFLSLFQGLSQSQGQINKVVNEHSVDPQTSYSGLTSRIRPLKLGLFLSPYFLLIFISTLTFISHHGWRNFQIDDAQITGKCNCESKN